MNRTSRNTPMLRFLTFTVAVVMVRGAAALVLLALVVTRTHAQAPAGVEVNQQPPLQRGLENLKNAEVNQHLPGTTIVTSTSTNLGDAETIKQIESRDAQRLRVHYSWNQVPVSTTARINVNFFLATSIDALQSGRAYNEIQFLDANERMNAPELRPGTTTLGVSTDILQELKTGREAAADLRSLGGGESYLPGHYKAIEADDVPVRVVVNDQEMDLPTVHARGDFGSETGEFWFLDNPAAPISLKFSIQKGGNHFNLQVVKIVVPVAQKETIASALKDERHVALEGIYFDFDKVAIRPESGAVLSSVAEVLRENPSWKVRVEGHTDNIGTDAYNMKLAMGRAAAVRQALVAQYRVSATRLTTAGSGAGRPKTTNDTLEGRAFNRRVELVRTDQAK
jgi:outer membrane protein OmpA-like peptidoglycan-associated protein